MRENVTPEELRRLDALVAEKVMGWRRDEGYPWWIHADNCGHGQQIDRWSPSTDIAAAWTVVEKLDLPFELTSDDEHTLWHARFNLDYGQWEDAHAAPLAICLAALKAVGG